MFPAVGYFTDYFTSYFNIAPAGVPNVTGMYYRDALELLTGKGVLIASPKFVQTLKPYVLGTVIWEQLVSLPSTSPNKEVLLTVYAPELPTSLPPVQP